MTRLIEALAMMCIVLVTLTAIAITAVIFAPILLWELFTGHHRRHRYPLDHRGRRELPAGVAVRASPAEARQARAAGMRTPEQRRLMVASIMAFRLEQLADELDENAGAPVASLERHLAKAWTLLCEQVKDHDREG